MKVSVIVPAHNAAGELAECLAAVRASNGPQPSEVIVAADNSTDETATVARSAGARVIELRGGGGPAAARNAGAAAASGDVLIFFDADCVPEPGCLQALVRPFSDPRVAGVRGGYASRQHALVARFTQLELDEKQDRLARSSKVTVMDTACVAYRRSIFNEAGGFDEHLPATSAEDVEFSFRLAARGRRLVYAPGAVVRHRHPALLGTYLRRKLRFGFYRALLYRQYPERLREDGYTPRMMPFQIALAGLLCMSGALSPWLAIARLWSAYGVLLFAGACMPMVYRAWRSDRALAAFTPGLLFGRSLAQGLGLLAGLGVVAWQQLIRCRLDASSRYFTPRVGRG
jgi:GT2 family glycosyltransferase